MDNDTTATVVCATKPSPQVWKPQGKILEDMWVHMSGISAKAQEERRFNEVVFDRRAKEEEVARKLRREALLLEMERKRHSDEAQVWMDRGLTTEEDQESKASNLKWLKLWDDFIPK